MSRRYLFGATALACAASVLCYVLLGLRVTTCPAADEKEAPAKDVFGATKVWAFHLEISAKEYEAMQPPPGGFGPPGAPPAAPKDKRDSERNLFGTEFPWAQAEFMAEDKTYKKIGVRYAGEVTYFASAQGLKRPLKIEFDKFGEQRFHGLSALQLHAMPLDPAKCREVLAYAVFRAAGVPTLRTAFAEVTLTVPGKFDKEYLGLYAVVENVDKPFLADRFGTDKGLLMKPFQVRSMEALGDDWERYKGAYRPQSEPTKEEAKRVIEFAKLVNQAKDDEFEKKIDSYLDVDEFLRFLAANALTSNLESSVALGHNYHLYLNPKTNKFVFIPGDLEFSLANFLLFGTAEQLMDLSLTHPYPRDNKLVERLLANKDVSAKYQKLLQELSKKVFAKEQWVKDLEAIEKLTKEPLAKEKKATEARKERAPGFGPPGGGAPQAPDLKTFAEKRTASITAQLAGKSKGYIPAGFGQPPGGGGGGPVGGGPAQPIDEKTFRDTVKAPDGFDVSLFAVPPKVNYPVALAAAPTGELFVAVDEQGSVGRTPGGGKVLRVVDKDGDGKNLEITTFAKMDHPRGVIYQDGQLWVLHSSFLSVYHDGGKGVADKSEVLVTGLTSDMVNQRGGDHATNGIRMGLDGWIYIAVGDYGPPEAKGKDGSKITMRGGIVRVRPDGTDLEIFATGLRNPFDIGMDPFMNLFTRDNDDNRAGGWDIRVSHLMQSAYYGYSQHYANFPDEIMPPLGQFGGGSGTGNLYLQDQRWPEKFRNVLLTCDWGRSEVYRHELRPNGATFDLKQEVFLKFPRPTGIDMDGSGRLYLASWRGGEASNYVGPNVGFIARVTPRGFKPTPFTNLREADLGQLIDLLSGPNSVARRHSQRELLRRGRKAETTAALLRLASDGKAPLEGRAIAIFALKQLDGKDSHPALLKLVQDAAVREFALRALTDRKKELDGLDTKPFVAALTDESARVRAQALISLGRLNDMSVAKHILPLTARPKGSVMPTKTPVHAQPDPDRVLPHLAVRTLVSLGAVDACVEALDGPYAQGALWAMRDMHDKRAVEGLIKKLGTTRALDLRRDVLATLARLYNREADYKGVWWGIRPENVGPYFDPVEWDQSKRIGAVLTRAVLDSDAETAAFLRKELARDRVALAGLPSGADTTPGTEKEVVVVVPKADPKNLDQIGNLKYEVATKRTLAAKGDATKGEGFFKAQLCGACHTYADGQTLKGPHLVGIGKRYSAAELVESVLKPSAKIAQGFETYRFDMADGKVFIGFVVSERAKTVLIREATGNQRELKLAQIEAREIQKQSMMPDGVVNNLTPEQLADLIAYLQSLTGGDDSPKKPDPTPKPPNDRPAPPAKNPAAPIARTDPNSRTAHEQLLEKAKKGRIDAYFVGDSITRRWGATDYPDFLANWKKNFFGWNAANFGWGADSIQNILWRLDNGELDKVNPKIIVLLAGTNNIGSAGGDEAKVADVTAGIKAALDTCRKKAPDAVIILMGITPRNDKPAFMAIINKVNERLGKFADGKTIRYLNINDKLADKEGKLLEGMSPDGLHLSAKGYQVWADALKPIFTELLGPPAKEDLAPPPTGDPSATRQPTVADDYQNMLDQLGIKKMRRGRDGARDTSDEATANPYKDSLPDLMTFKDGKKVKTADDWTKRRAEIVEDFEREVYGRVPKNVPKVKWEVTKTVEGESGGIATVTKTLVGHVDNSDFPKIKVDIQASFTVPKFAKGKVPVLLQFGGGFGGSGGPNSWTQQALDKGWGYGTINPNSIQGDNNKLREGIIGLTNKGEPRKPDDWGALRAWGWGVSRLIDYFEANPESGVDASKVCITGVSRYGKAALVTTAFDTRVAAGFVASSGAGGAKLFRRDFGELLENLSSRGEYHWMAGNFLKYGADEAKSDKKTAADLPVDQHMLIALCAPRPCFISYGVPEKGDPKWVDAHGSFMAAVLAGPAYRVLGKKDLGTPGDYLTDKMPAVNKLIGGELAWRQHDGGHTNVPNFPAFYEWAGGYISTPGLDKKK